MICSGRRYLTITLMVIPNEEFPPVAGGVKMIQVIGNQIIEKGAFHLTTKNVEFRS